MRYASSGAAEADLYLENCCRGYCGRYLVMKVMITFTYLAEAIAEAGVNRYGCKCRLSSVSPLARSRRGAVLRWLLRQSWWLGASPQLIWYCVHARRPAIHIYAMKQRYIDGRQFYLKVGNKYYSYFLDQNRFRNFGGEVDNFTVIPSGTGCRSPTDADGIAHNDATWLPKPTCAWRIYGDELPASAFK